MKKKLLRIFLFLTLLIGLIVPSELNGPRRKVEAATISGGVTTLYLKPNANWKQQSAWFACYFYDESAGKNSWVEMKDVDGNGTYYYCVAPTGTWKNLIFCRMNSGNKTLDWNYKWNQSGNLTYDGTNDLFTLPSGSWDNATTSWSKFSGLNLTCGFNLKGSFNNWDDSDVFKHAQKDEFKVVKYLDAGQYTFKLTKGDSWYGNNGTVNDDMAGNWWNFSTSNSSDCTLKASGGKYTFLLNPKDKNLLIQYEEISSTVILNQQSGTGGTANVTAYYGKTMPSITKPTRTGYTFSGYYTGTNGTGTQYYDGDGNSVKCWNETNASVTLYAKWTANKYTISLNDQDATSTTHQKTKTATYNSPIEDISSSKIPTKIGYIFGGYFSEKNGNGTKYFNSDGTSTKITYSKAGGMTVYAYWIPINYNIVFNANGGSGTMENQTLTYDVSDKLTANTFTKIGYNFTKWNTKEDGTGTSYTDGQSVSKLVSENGGSITLYAQWSTINYTISFNANGGTGTAPTTINTSYSSIVTLPQNTFKKELHIFAGWNTKSDYSGTKYEEGQSVSNLGTTEGQNVTLYAQWVELKSHVITLDVNGAKNYNSNITDFIIYEKVGYGYIQNLPNDLIKDGHTFQGWKNCNGVQVGNNTEVPVEGILDNYTLTAIWDEHKYNISFDGNEATSGSTDAMNQVLYTHPAELNPNGFERTGYTFAGWSRADDGKVEFSDKDIVSCLASTTTNNQTITLYAVWTANKYTIKFNANGGSGTMENLEMLYGTPKALTQNEYTRTGYTFAGWTLNKDDSEPVYSDGELVNNLAESGEITLYAKWTPNKYTIVLHSNDGSDSKKEITATYDQLNEKLPLNSFSLTGREIEGWSTTPDGEVEFTDTLTENLYVDQNTKVDLYAKWKLVDYSISYDYKGGTGNNPATYNYETETITLTAPTKENYTFAGWADGNGNKLGMEVTIPQHSTGKKTFVALWDQKVTVYIDMTPIYNQYTGVYKIDEPFIHYFNSKTNSGTWGTVILEQIGKSNYYKKDIYFVEENVVKFSNIENIVFAYYQTDNSNNFTKGNETISPIISTVDIPFNVDGTCNGKDYVFTFDNEKYAIRRDFEPGKTYTITNLHFESEHHELKTKWFSYDISESSGTPNKITFILDDTGWDGITKFKINGTEVTQKVDGKWKIVFDYYLPSHTYEVTKFDVSFLQPKYGTDYWVRIYDPGNKFNTNSYDLYTKIHSMNIIESPQVNYYHGDTLLYTANYFERNQIKFIEQEGYRLDGWYTDTNFTTKFTSTTNVDRTMNIYGKYVPAEDYYIYCDAKDLPWNPEKNNMHVYMFNSYFYDANTKDKAHENSAWGDNPYGGDTSCVTYIKNGIYKVKIDVSKSYDQIIFSVDGTTTIHQTTDIILDPYHTYYILSPNKTEDNKYDIYYEESVDNFLETQKIVDDSSDNAYRFIAGLKSTTTNGLTTGNKEFGYKFIFIKGDSTYVGYWNFTKSNMLDFVRYEGTLNEAGVNNTYKGYYALTLKDDVTFDYADYDQLVVIACYRDANNITRVIKANEYHIIGTPDNIQLYEIER